MTSITESLRTNVDTDLKAIASSFQDLGKKVNNFEKTLQQSIGKTTAFKLLQEDVNKFKTRVSSGLATTSRAFLDLDKDVGQFSQGLTTSFKVINKSSGFISSATTSAGKFSKALLAIGASGASLAIALFPLLSISATLGSVATVGLKAYDSFKELQGVSKTLTFSETVLGSSKLRENFELVEATSNKVIDSFKLLSGAALNSEAFTRYSTQGIEAFKGVETAAFRLNTILVQGSERSIDKIDSTIKSMRELQKATNFAVDSVTLLNTQYDIASGGFTSQTAIEQVGSAGTNLATAGFGDQVESTGALIKVLRALGDEAEDAEKRAAQLFETTKVGITTIPELSGYIGPLAAQAKSLGIDFAEVAAALANLTTQGLGTAEATTALSSLLDEIAANGDQAKEALAGFADESGKTIQLGAGQLKERGIAGVLKGIQDATKGQLPALQKIFSSSTAQTGAQLLINSGVDNLSANASQIQNVDSSKLAQEAADRATTLEGAFTQAFNKSQSQAEDFGQALRSSVIDRLAETNTLLGSVGSGTASFLGSVSGKFDVFTDKLSAVGGFVATAFSTIVPVVFFNLLFASIPKVAAKFGELFQKASGLKPSFQNLFEGISIIGKKAFDRLVTAIKAALDKAKQQVKAFALEVKKELDNLEKPVNIAVNTPDPANLKSAEVPDTVQQVKTNVDTSTAIQSFTQLESAADVANTQIQQSTAVTTTSVKQLGAQSVATAGKTSLIGKAGKLAFSGIAATIKTSILSLGAFALAGAALAAGFQIIAGWASAIGQRLNEKTNPAVAELASSLKEIENNKALQKLAQEIDNSSTSISSSNIGLATSQDLIARLGGAWNFVTGATASYEQFLQRSLQAQDILSASIEKTNKLAAEGRFEGRTVEARTAQNKLDRGLNLSAEDTNALQAETDENILEVKKQIALKQEQINEFQAKGSRDSGELEELEKELSLLKRQGEEQENLLKKRLNIVKANQLSSELRNLDTNVPLNIQLGQQTFRQVSGEIDFLKKKFSDAFSADNIDPDALNQIFPQLQSSLGAINVQAKVDPQAALQSLQNIQSIPNFDKLLFGDLNFRRAFSEAFSQVTEEAVKSSATVESVFNTALQSVAANFSNVPEFTILVNENSINSINSQIAAITAELNSQAVPYARQIELLSQIEQLEAKRSESIASSEVAKEIPVRQQVLTITESILQAEQARINLLSKEDKFATGLIAAAKARTQAAETELAIRKEQLSIAAREEQIKKQQGIAALEARIQRNNNTSVQQESSGAATSPSVSIEQTQVDIIKSTYDSQKSKIDETYERQKALIEETYAKQKEVIAKEEADTNRNLNDNSLSVSQQNDVANRVSSFIKEAGFAGQSAARNTDSGLAQSLIFGNDRARREALFNEDGNLKNQEQLTKLLENVSRTAGIDNTAQTAIKDIFNQARIARFEEAGGDLNRFNREREGAASQRESSLAALENTTKAQQQAAAAKQAEDARLQSALEAAKKDLELSKALSGAKQALETFSSVVALSEARIEEEFAAREKAIQQNSLLAESLNKIASSSSFADSSAGIDLSSIALQISDPLAVVVKDAEKAFAQLNAKIELQEQSLSDAKAALAQAQAAGASEQQLAPLRDRVRKEEEVLRTTREEAPLDQAFILIKTGADRVAASLQIAEQGLEKEFAARDRVIKQSEKLSSSLSGLSSTAGSLFSSSAAGASLSRLATETSNPVFRAETETQRELAQVDIRNSSLRQLANEAGAAVQEGIRAGLPEAALAKLVENRDRAEEQASKAETGAESSRESIRQRGVIDSLTASLEVFNSKVQEVNAVLTSQGQIFKDTINLFVQSQKDIADSNNAIRAADQGFLSIFGSNNPFTEILQRQADADKIREQGTLQQTEAIAASQQEFIDLSILDQQLSLEQQGYENALTQTQLLSDLIRVSQGQEARFSQAGGQADQFLNRLPQILEQNAQLTNQRREITQEQLARIQPRLDQRLQNIQLESAGSLLSNAAGSGDPRLIADALRTFREVRPEASFRQLEDPRSRNISSEFQAISQSFAQTRDMLTNSSSQALQNSRNQSNNNSSGSSVVLNAQIPITITNSSNGIVRSENMESIRSSVNSAVQSGLNQIAQRVARK